MSQILPYFLGVASAVCGYLLKRWWEGRSLKGRIQSITDLLKLHNELSAAKVSENVLSELRDEIFKKNRWQKTSEVAILEKIGIGLREKIENDESGMSSFQTQRDMNRYALHLADLAEHEMNYLADELGAKIDDDDERKSFQKVQRAWHLFARRQAYFASLWVSGGSMQPLIYSSEYRNLAIDRATQLSAELRERAEQFG
jgi:Uncharacterized protein conserved in bacteria